ncbi:hypothetical protein [Cellulomonas chengniuliangii]|uniref:hypothetical protein n=1 Tax=Cellulomonas chengniuliangii TaxID=2968084 RepID=UPI001D0E7C07|nr:hypothetical protein [Cellulomonas chengniuliangii]MCC2317040.1 hypothetical protein [Cellulomonas chengniuliangii]
MDVSEEALSQLLLLSGGDGSSSWRSMVEGRDHLAGDSFIMVGTEGERGEDIYVTRDSGAAAAETLDLIAAARTHLPALIEEVRRLRAATAASSPVEHRTQHQRPVDGVATTGTNLAHLVGEELAGVFFVRDYVELSFDGPTLRAFSGPVVSLHGVSATFPGLGSRDLLCALIARTVESVDEDASALVVNFAGGGVIRVPLWEAADVAEVAALVPARTGHEEGYEPTVYWENVRPTREA